jgi:drug/metabolite transporter (DMT)-like permease
VICGLVAGGRLDTWTGQGVAMLIYLALVSAVAYSLWGILLKYNPVSKVAVFGFMNPVFGVILSAVLLSESGSISVISVVALALVCLGIYIVNVNKAKPYL